MRGALRLHHSLSNQIGIIPADAGSTALGERAGEMVRDHPRGCGEHDYLHDLRWAQEGSSPRMRGALHRRRSRHPGTGIIPADAGST